MYLAISVGGQEGEAFFLQANGWSPEAWDLITVIFLMQNCNLQEPIQGLKPTPFFP